MSEPKKITLYECSDDKGLIVFAVSGHHKPLQYVSGEIPDFRYAYTATNLLPSPPKSNIDDVEDLFLYQDRIEYRDDAVWVYSTPEYLKRDPAAARMASDTASTTTHRTLLDCLVSHKFPADLDLFRVSYMLEIVPAGSIEDSQHAMPRKISQSSPQVWITRAPVVNPHYMVDLNMKTWPMSYILSKAREWVLTEQASFHRALVTPVRTTLATETESKSDSMPFWARRGRS